jgi:hypothetical protein
MKASILTLLSLIFCAGHLFATDRIVQQNGPAGTFSSISAAITAAVDGDVVVINNRTDGTAWTESLTINKSITLISASDNTQWWMSGSVTFTLQANRVISLIGMRNTLTGATIGKSGTVPNAANRMAVSIVNSEIAANISLTNVNLYLASCKITGTVVFSFGKILGCDINKTVTMNSDDSYSEDVNLVIGNKLMNTAISGTTFTANSLTQYLYFSNNFVRGNTTSPAFRTLELKAGAVGNRITNCTILYEYTGSTGSALTALSLSHNTGTLAVENNIITGNYFSATTGGNGILVQSWASSSTTFTYNMYNNPHSGGTNLNTALFNFENTSLSTTNFTVDGVYSGGGHVNAGNPGNTYLDLNLTRNDIGAYGGSYSLENFLPVLNGPQSSRVNLITGPRVVNQGGNVTIEAIGFDK